MKSRLTKSEVLSSHYEVAEIGYCELQTVLGNIRADYYTCGVYGWNSDIYEIGNGYAICTGYRPFGTFRPDHNTVKNLEKKAEKIYGNRTWKHDTKVRKIKELLLTLFADRTA